MFEQVISTAGEPLETKEVGERVNKIVKIQQGQNYFIGLIILEQKD
jgi:hypothetical protein